MPVNRDPRKRAASKSPDARGPKRPATGTRESSPAIRSRNSTPLSNAISPVPVPVADMARKTQNDQMVQLKTRVALQTATVASLQSKYDEAKTRLKGAEDSHRLASDQGHFDSFPAMKETKTAAVEIAKKSKHSASLKLNSAQLELERRVASLAELETSIFTPSKDAISRVEFEALRADLTGLKEDLSRVKEDLSSAKKGLSKRIDDCTTRMDVAAPAAPDRLDAGIQTKLDHINESHTKLRQLVEEGFTDCKQKQDDAMKKLAEALKKKQLDDITRVDGELSQLDADVADLHRTLTDNAKSVQQCLDKAKSLEGSNNQFANKDALATLEASFQQLSERVDTINSIRQVPTPGPSLSAFQPISGADDEEEIAPPQRRQIPNGTLHSVGYHDIQQLKEGFEGLRLKLQELTTRHNNLTTDHMAQCMLSQMGTVYPHIHEAEKYFKGVVQSVQALEKDVQRIQALEKDVKAVASRVDDGVVQRIQALEKDVKAVASRVDDIFGKVTDISNTVEVGKLQLDDHSSQIKSLHAGLQKAEQRIALNDTGRA